MFSLGKIKINEPQTSRLTNFRQQWYRKWNRVCATIVCILGFSLVLAVVIQGGKNGKCGISLDNKASNEKILRKIPIGLKKGCNKLSTCELNCVQVDAKILSATINIIFDNKECSQINSLTLTQIIFPNNTLRKDQFILKQNVEKLKFQYCELETIEEKSFDNPTFAGLTDLTFQGAHLTYLHPDFFQGLSSVTTFNIRENKNKIIFDKKLLNSFPSLEILQIEKALSPDGILNLTGCTYMNELKSITFRYNDKLTAIYPRSILARQLESLYITDNALTFIDENAFVELRQLQSLDLQNNRLATLNELAFKFVPNVKLFISGNVWICDCHLIWLKRMKVVDVGNAECTSPVGVELDKFGFCKFGTTSTRSLLSTTTTAVPTTIIETSTMSTVQSSPSTKQLNKTTSVSTTVTTTSVSTTLRTTTSSPDVINVACKTRALSSYASNLMLRGSDRSLNLSLNKTVVLQVNENSNGSLSVLLISQSKLRTLFWMDTKSNVHCIVTRDYQLVLNEVDPNTSYVLCGMEGYGEQISPLNCKAVTTRPKEENRVWLENRHIVPVTLGAIFFIIFIIVLTSGAVYFLLRKYPFLLQFRKHRSTLNDPGEISMYPDTTSVPIYFKKVVKPMTFARCKAESYITPISTIASLTQSTGERDSFRSNTASYVPTEEVMTTWRVYTKTRRPVAQLFERGALSSPPLSPQLTPPIPPPRPRPKIEEPDFRGSYLTYS